MNRRLARRLTRTAATSARDRVDLLPNSSPEVHTFPCAPSGDAAVARSAARGSGRARAHPARTMMVAPAPALPPAPGFGASFAPRASPRFVVVAAGGGGTRAVVVAARAGRGRSRPRRAEALARAAPDPREAEAEAAAAAAARAPAAHREPRARTTTRMGARVPPPTRGARASPPAAPTRPLRRPLPRPRPPPATAAGPPAARRARGSTPARPASARGAPPSRPPSPRAKPTASPTSGAPKPSRDALSTPSGVRFKRRKNRRRTLLVPSRIFATVPAPPRPETTAFA